MDNVWFASALWIGLALVAASLQAWVAVSVALLEIIIGAIAGNLVDLTLTPWVNYLAGFGAILLTFLAGAEIDAKVIRRHFGSTMAIGAVGFFAPYLGVLAWAHFISGRPWPQAQIAGIALGRRRVVRGLLAGVEEVVAASDCKAALHLETGAAAVDMESHIAAAYASEADLPFAALRVISDPAHRALPAFARKAIKPNGDLDLRQIVGSVVRNPRTLRALVSTGIDFNRALRSLRGCRSFLLGSSGLVTADL